jgi:hypothetical protein
VRGTSSQKISTLRSPRLVCRVTDMMAPSVRMRVRGLTRVGLYGRGWRDPEFWGRWHARRRCGRPSLRWSLLDCLALQRNVGSLASFWGVGEKRETMEAPAPMSGFRLGSSFWWILGDPRDFLGNLQVPFYTARCFLGRTPQYFGLVQSSLRWLCPLPHPTPPSPGQRTSAGLGALLVV